MSVGSQDQVDLRRQISCLWITLLSSFALWKGTESIQIIIMQEGLFHISSFGLPFVFFITLLRFMVGNLMHMSKISVLGRVWFYDFSVITLESILFILMGAFSFTDPHIFLTFLLFLCYVDFTWIYSMIATRAMGMRRFIPWGWGILNLVSILLLTPIVLFKVPFPSTDLLGLTTIVIWFTIAALIDVVVMDHYNLLEPLQKKRHPQEKNSFQSD